MWVALGNRGMIVEAARQCRKIGRSGEPWYLCNRMSFTSAFSLRSMFFRTALPCSDHFHLERDGMRLRSTIIGAQLLKIKLQVSSTWAMRCLFDDCVCVCVCYLT